MRSLLNHQMCNLCDWLEFTSSGRSMANEKVVSIANKSRRRVQQTTENRQPNGARVVKWCAIQFTIWLKVFLMRYERRGIMLTGLQSSHNHAMPMHLVTCANMNYYQHKFAWGPLLFLHILLCIGFNWLGSLARCRTTVNYVSLWRNRSLCATMKLKFTRIHLYIVRPIKQHWAEFKLSMPQSRHHRARTHQHNTDRDGQCSVCNKILNTSGTILTFGTH